MALGPKNRDFNCPVIGLVTVSSRACGTPEVPSAAGCAGRQRGWGRHRDLPAPPGSPQTPGTSQQCSRHRMPFAGSLTPRVPPGVRVSPSARAAALPLPRGLPAGCHVAPEPRCRSRRRSVSLRVAHLKFQLAGCFRAGGMQNQPANTNKYLLHPPPLQFSFSFLLPSWFWGGNGFSKLSINVCNNRKRCLLACGRHSFK